MDIFKNITKRSAGQGLGLLIFLIGAAGMDVSQWGLFGLKITGIPQWCFALTTSVGGILFFLSQMMFAPNPLHYKRSNHEQEDIFLYLRPFSFDVNDVFQLGLGASTGLIVYATLLKGLWWPLALIPLVANLSKEQSFKHIFEQLGEFVALGYPKDVLKPIAATVVFENEGWQEKIGYYIKKARLVIVYPGEQAGIKWEIDQVMENVPPERILFYLKFKGGKGNRQRLYRTFREQMSNHAVVLPADIGVEEYLIFDAQKRPQFIRELTFREALISYFKDSEKIPHSNYGPILAHFGLNLPTGQDSRAMNLFFIFQPLLVVFATVLALYSIGIILF